MQGGRIGQEMQDVEVINEGEKKVIISGTRESRGTLYIFCPAKSDVDKGNVGKDEKISR